MMKQKEYAAGAMHFADEIRFSEKEKGGKKEKKLKTRVAKWVSLKYILNEIIQIIRGLTAS
jgi:hypothetical protein